MRNSRSIRTSTFAITVALALSACSTFDQGGSGDSESRTLTISLQFTPKADFALETDDAYVLSQVGCLETLLTYDEEAGELQPMLATEWTQSTPSTWDFTLRDGVKFQDGTELTADAVAGALDHVLTAATPPRAFTPKVVSKVEAVNPTTVRITTPAPSALLPFRLASVNTGILAPAAYQGAKIDPIRHCTGPYTPASVAPGQSISLDRNDNYWNGRPALDHVDGRFIVEGATRATQVRTGESQVALGIPATSLPELESDADLSVTKSYIPRTSGLYFNVTKAPFDNPDTRKAIRDAIDLAAIAKSVYDGGAQPATGPFAPDEPWAPKNAEPAKQDFDAAKTLLTKAGVQPGQLNLTLLAYNERPEFADLATVIQADLAKIGVTVTIQTGEYASMEPALLAGDFDLALLSRNHLTDIADPIGFLTADYTCDGGFNLSHFCDPALDAKIASANEMTEPDDRNALYAEVASQLQDEAVTVFLVHEQTVAAHANTVKGFVDDPLGRYAATPTVTIG
ncbi:ABC transporter substrate-binding protein [Actinophytocola sp.]|uniref:ABC transporter substrate-binding protein n=1 Tax=Actinophytocola sp. TaxID=1872138 RepID=UPI002ED3196F